MKSASPAGPEKGLEPLPAVPKGSLEVTTSSHTKEHESRDNTPACRPSREMSLNTGAKPRAGDPSQMEKSPFVVLSTMLQLACLGEPHGRSTSDQCTCHQTYTKSSRFRFSSAWENQPPAISHPKECHRGDDSVRCLVSQSVSQMEGGEGQ